MTNNYILNIAMQQSSIDSNCDIDDFKSFENKVVISKAEYLLPDMTAIKVQQSRFCSYYDFDRVCYI